MQIKKLVTLNLKTINILGDLTTLRLRRITKCTSSLTKILDHNSSKEKTLDKQMIDKNTF